MKKTLTIFAFIFLGAMLYAQSSGKLMGIITDENTGEPLIGANVVIEGTFLGAATNVEGRYVILNIPPGIYNVKVSMVGYDPVVAQNVRINIDQTTNLNFKLKDIAFQTGEVVVTAEQPVVQKDVAASGVNLNVKEVEKLPVVTVAGVVGLQAGISGESVRGGGATETVYMVNGISMRNARDNTSYSNIPMTSVEQIQVTTGGFSAEYGDVRSGLINVVTKEGDRKKYSISFFGRYSPASKKHFGPSPHDRNSYFLRPYLDDDVCWTGTKNGAWDEFMQKQYPEFVGWNKISENLLNDNDPNNDLSPKEAQRLFLWQHRRNLEIKDPDYDYDMSFGGPVPFISEELGGLRFFASFRQEQFMYLVPLSKDRYSEYAYNIKLTSDVGTGMKLMGQFGAGRVTGTNTSGSGFPGVHKSSAGIANRIAGTFQNAYLYVPQYFSPTEVKSLNFGAKFTHVLDSKTFYEITFSSFISDYLTGPGKYRDTTKRYKFGDNFWVDEAPFGYYDRDLSGVDGMRMGAPISVSRDTSYVATYRIKADFATQLNSWNEIKTGFEASYTVNDVNFGRYDRLYFSTNVNYKWTNYPISGAFYIRDKMEFEMMVATIGLRLDYSDPNDTWWDYDTYEAAFSATKLNERDQIKKVTLPAQLTLSPRIAIAFPITVNSKLFFNYGHFRDLPTPSNLYTIITDYQGNVTYVSNPRSPMQKTVAYELGYEQNLIDQFLLRITGYYKDITNEPVDITYVSKDNKVQYTRPEPNRYRDIRGFEFEINKNRGNWIQGFFNYTYMVTSLGYFGWGAYYENIVRQIDYEKSSTWHVQSKPKPQPYARLSVDLFTPGKFGPEFGGLYPIGDWRLNLLSTWSAGSYMSWNGGKPAAEGFVNNLQYKDNYNTNLKLTKNLQFGPVDFQIFLQINNLFNDKIFTIYGFSDLDDRLNYFKSLHLPESKLPPNMGYINIPGKDQPGDYNKAGYYQPIVAAADLNDPILQTKKNVNYLYYVKSENAYYQWNGSAYVPADQKLVKEVLDKKAYIDMPNKKFFTFLNPRDMYWGIRFNVAL
jgi:outer membrane receptor protein involved in Fe transport